MSTLAEQQATLVRALVAGGELPSGFDSSRVDAALRALLRKRAHDVSKHWPALLAGAETRERFAHWADGRPKSSSFDDGLAFALEEQATGRLSPAAAAELRRNRPGRWRRRR